MYLPPSLSMYIHIYIYTKKSVESFIVISLNFHINLRRMDIFLILNILIHHACTRAKLLQLCPTLCDPIDCRPPGSSVHQTPPSMGFSRQEYWGGFLRPPPGGRPETEPAFLTFLALAGRFFTTSASWEAPNPSYFVLKIKLILYFAL